MSNALSTSLPLPERDALEGLVTMMQIEALGKRGVLPPLDEPALAATVSASLTPSVKEQLAANARKTRVANLEAMGLTARMPAHIAHIGT